MEKGICGLNFYKERPRHISVANAAKWVLQLPPFVQTVGVFVNEDEGSIIKTVDKLNLKGIQLHGDETPEFCQTLLTINVKTMKALRVKTAEDIARAEDYYTDAILLDAFDSEQYGGTGQTFDWNIIGHIGKRVFLAGGITPDNAADAVKLGVYGIDVCSGVESEPGRKDHVKMKALFDSIKFVRI